MNPIATRLDIFRGRLRSGSLAVKLALLSAAATAMIVFIAFLALRARVESDVLRVFVPELAASQQGVRDLQDRARHLLLATSSLVSTSPTLRAALQTWRVEANAGLPHRADLIATIQREVEGIYDGLDSDVLIVADDSGRVLASAGRYGVPRPGESLLALPAVRYALASRTVGADSSFGVLTRGFGKAASAALQVGCVAIQLEGYPVGVLLLGERLDRAQPRAGSARTTGFIVTVGNAVLSSTVPGVAAGQRWRAPEAEQLNAATKPTRIGREDYAMASLPLGLSETGQPATLHLARSITASLAPVTESLGRSVLIFGIVVVVLAGLGAAIVARTNLRPLARFISFMREGAESGAYTHFAGAKLPAEIATLTGAYNRLMDSLSRQHMQLENRTSELATSNEALRGEVLEREQAESALRESEEQLRQSQKLEALGTLAGGVAHDFNNMLAVILGYAHFTIDELPENSPVRADVDKIIEAGTRASTLVRQLLAFSRKQVLQPQVVDLNAIVTGLESMLRRLIGEDIDLRIIRAEQLTCIHADPGQIEQVLMNLVVNGRDAMPTGGRLTIETANVHLEDRPEPDSIAAGPAAMLCVSDTGMGMDATTRERIFEPFFTTKGPDKGTGLGLSTVYGIIRQSGGAIKVLSQPGAGSTFHLFFPGVAGRPARSRDYVDSNAGAPAHGETVLVVEDDSNVRAMTRRALTGFGYHVLDAANGRAGLARAASHDGPIDLLLTDVVMPHMSGPELARQMRSMQPGLRVIFMSGHSDEAIERHGVLAPGAVFLQKPILPDALARAVRELLEVVPAGTRT